MSIILMAIFVALAAAAKPPPNPYPIVGNTADVAATLNLGGPVYDLGGGGYDVDMAFQRTIDLVRGCTGSSCATKIDVVIVRATGTDAYNPYIYSMNGVDSCQTLIVSSVTQASDPLVDAAIRGAEFVFFAGGDQCDYVTYYKGTPVEAAVEFAYSRGAAIGGTSAGMAIMGPFVYDACLTSSGTTSTAALSNPYDRTISFTYNFFAFQYMTNVITDQHFVTRDRMGRLLSFMARQIKDGKGTYVWGIAANEETSIVVDEVGSALVVRNDGVTGYDVPLPPASANPVAYYIYLDHMPEVCASKKPLTCTGYKVWKRAYDQTFNMATKPTTNPDYTISVSAGVMTSSTGSVY